MLLNHKERESYQREFYRKQGWVERETVANFIYLDSRKTPSVCTVGMDSGKRKGRAVDNHSFPPDCPLI
ncbi:MAG: hypothetical protein RMZ41_031910 [Nostoc sp. DedVER02]